MQMLFETPNTLWYQAVKQQKSEQKLRGDIVRGAICMTKKVHSSVSNPRTYTMSDTPPKTLFSTHRSSPPNQCPAQAHTLNKTLCPCRNLSWHH